MRMRHKSSWSHSHSPMPRYIPVKTFRPVIGLFAALSIGGCAAGHRQMQTFIAEDPNSGERALYQVEIVGKGLGSVKYTATARYLPQSSVDLYAGNIPQSLADFNAANLVGTDEDSTAAQLLNIWHQMLIAEAQALQKIPEAMKAQLDEQLQAGTLDQSKLNGLLLMIEDPEQRTTIERIMAENIMRATRSLADLQSIGESGRSDAYGFRKLVYFISSEPISVTDFENELTEIEGTVNTIAKALGEARKARQQASRQKREQQKQRITQILGFMKGTDGNPPDLSNPTTAMQLLGLLGGFGQ